MSVCSASNAGIVIDYRRPPAIRSWFIFHAAAAATGVGYSSPAEIPPYGNSPGYNITWTLRVAKQGWVLPEKWDKKTKKSGQNWQQLQYNKVQKHRILFNYYASTVDFSDYSTLQLQNYYVINRVIIFRR